MTSKKALQGEQQFFADIRDLLHAGRETAYRSVNTIMVKTYWQIGRELVSFIERESREVGYGE
jgi:hypothetical protein